MVPVRFVNIVRYFHITILIKAHIKNWEFLLQNRSINEKMRKRFLTLIVMQITIKNNAFFFFSESFLTIFSKRQLNINQNLNSARAIQIVENRKRLISIVQTLLLCSRQELTLCGTSDSGVLILKKPIFNDGNFRASLRM